MKNTKKNQTVQTAEAKQNSIKEQKQTAETKKEEKVMKEQKTEAKQNRTEVRDAKIENILKTLSADKTLTVEVGKKQHGNLITVKRGKTILLLISVKPQCYDIACKQTLADACHIAYTFKEKWSLKALMKTLSEDSMKQTVTKLLSVDIEALKAEAKKQTADAKKQTAKQKPEAKKTAKKQTAKADSKEALQTVTA